MVTAVMEAVDPPGILFLQRSNDRVVMEVKNMVKSLFKQLEPEKRKRIIDAGIREFAEKSYSEASTNRVVKEAGISKGSLFKYFDSKEDLYFYLLDQAIAELSAGIADRVKALKGDIFDIILQYAEAEFDWHLNNPDRYRLMKRAFTDDGSEIYEKTKERYRVSAESMYEELLEGMDPSRLRGDPKKVSKLIRWVLEGFNREFINRYRENRNSRGIRKEYMAELKGYLEMIKAGVSIADNKKDENLSNIGGGKHV